MIRGDTKQATVDGTPVFNIMEPIGGQLVELAKQHGVGDIRDCSVSLDGWGCMMLDLKLEFYRKMEPRYVTYNPIGEPQQRILDAVGYGRPNFIRPQKKASPSVRVAA